MNTLTYGEAKDIFRREHAGQTDLQGRDYFEYHLIPVAERLVSLGEDAYIAGLGHDWIEDVWLPKFPASPRSHAGLALLNMGLPARSVVAIENVTRWPEESYSKAIDRIVATYGTEHSLAIHVKLADNAVNLTNIPSLAVVDNAKADRLLVKYRDSRDRLIAARERDRFLTSDDLNDIAGIIERRKESGT